MGLIDAFNEWISSRYENHISKMELENRCPDCYGKGFQLYPHAIELVPYDGLYDCPSCNGSGLFTNAYDA
ncbi:methionine aminopeptidase [Cytobacillus sp. FJAT-54145]|uniref:Methionine aminopeptidase n=1 Tax=Cytobacillus spartinae TaxID=3299023 RepID=A0ABW6KG25_9BACI